MSKFIPVVIYFSSKSSGQAVLSQAIDVDITPTPVEYIDGNNSAVVAVSGIGQYTHTVGTALWTIIDVSVDLVVAPVTILFTSLNSITLRQKLTKLVLDLSQDPDAQIVITLSEVAVADEFPAPDLWVKGPEAEMSQYQNAGQWYYNTTTGALEIYIPD